MTTLTAAELTTIRSDYHTVKRYLSPWQRNIVLSATVTSVTQDTDTYGIYEVGFDTVTLGTYANGKAGYTLDVYTSGGVRRGSLRLRKAAGAATLYVAESAPGEVNVTVGDIVKVIHERRIWRKLPYLAQTNTDTTDFFDTFDVFKDYDLAYTDENEDHRPIANIEYDPAGLVDSGQAYRTVYLNGANSEALADGATISSYSWDIGAGSFVSGYSSTDSAIYATFPVGQHEVSLTVTDSNTNTATRYGPLWSHGPSFMPLADSAFTVDSDETEYGNGRDLNITVFGNSYEARDDLIPQGTLFCYWEDAQFGAQAAPPDQYRSHYLGWAARDSSLIKIGFGEYFIMLEGAASQLARIDGSEQLFLARSSPSEWYEMADITSDREAAHILRYETTALDVCNLYTSGITDEWGQVASSNYGAGRVDKAPVWQQLAALSAEYGGFASCDSLNGIWLRRHPSLVEDGGSGRDDINTVIALTYADWTDAGFELVNEFTPRVGRLEMDGFAFDGAEPTLYQSKAPGRVPSYPASQETGPAQVLPSTSSDTVLASRVGKRYAWLNNPYSDVPLTLWGNFDIIEPAWMEWITLTASDDNIRGLSLSAARFLVKRVSIRHSNEPDQPHKQISLTIERETDGESGEAWEAPTSDVVDTTGNDYNWPGFDFGTWDGWNMFTGDGLGSDLYANEGAASTADTVYAADERYVYGCPDFTSAGTPTWSEKLDAVTDIGAGYYILDYQHDNLDPKNTAIVIVADKSASLRIYRTTNLTAGSPTWTLMQSISSAADRALLYNSIYDGVWFLLIQDGAANVFYKTVDDFTNIDTTIVAPCGGSPYAHQTFSISNHAASKTSGKIIMSYSGGSNQSHITISDDYGETFTPDTLWTFSDFHPPAMVWFPYHGNEAELTWYVMGGEDSTNDAWTVKTTDGGDNYTDISPTYDDGLGDGTLSYGGGEQNQLSKKYIADYTQDGNKLAMVAWPSTQNYGTSHQQQIFISDDGGDNWTRQSGTSQTINEIVVWPYDVNQLFFSGTTKLYYSSDRGVTLSEKQWTGYSNGVRCVPVWVS